MAKIGDVQLHIQKADASGKAWLLSATYSITLEPWERGSWFHERVVFVGVTSGGERTLATLDGPPMVPAPTSGDVAPVTVERRTPPVSLPRSDLDVSPDLVVSTPGGLVAYLRSDRLFVRVYLIPLAPTAAEAQSQHEVRQFGVLAEGADR